MKYLLDTHIILWIMSKTKKISDPLLETLRKSPPQDLYVSIASLWEVAIKTSIGKEDFPGGMTAFYNYVKKAGLTLLGIKPEYTKVVETLPFIHKEPFDRMLIATAKAEDMTLITADEKIHQYNVKTLWK